ncbi:MAG TPA: LamG domain-containing protein [Draconibacterium sp.]|nr:LamG domain-containing protein [Draconibacterium sp.]
MNSKLGFHSLLFILFSFSIISVSNGQNYSLHIKNSEHSCKEYNYFDIGDLSITGDKLTIEAIIRTISNGECQFSPHHDVVSKHYDNTDVNYLLRPGYATINTENGFYQTKPLTVTNNECHHIAMVYDGLFLRFYLDDFMDSVRATGNLITNNYNTLIGYTAGFNPNWYTQYFGYIDEVRFWNVARTKKQIKENAYTSIADPVNHDGLKAYFDFQTGYQNKAGNEIHNGVKKGNCALDVDTASCTVNHSPDKLNKIIMYPNLI